MPEVGVVIQFQRSVVSATLWPEPITDKKSRPGYGTLELFQTGHCAKMDMRVVSKELNKA